MPRVDRFLTLFLGVLCLLSPEGAQAQLEFEAPPILYSRSTPKNSITRVQNKLETGELKLEYDPQTSYLLAVLEALDIPRSSQMLVFSKTSLQLHRINPHRPRAIYFNDESYVGFVQGGEVLEISTVDPQLGGVFYTLSTSESPEPRFVRDQGQCLTCHASSRTEGVPGHLLRSVFVDRSGQPHYGSGTYSTNQESPFEKRWGGWYVTGMHGEMRHMGNVISPKNVHFDDLDRESGANLKHLDELVDTSPYLEKTSDIVALMVLGHQLEMHNLIARGNYEARNALHYNEVMNQALDRAEDFLSESTQRRISTAAEKIVRCLLFTDEATLTSPVTGVSSFQDDFSARGIRDRQGRSFRDFDLQTRLFKYPCSYLIHSEAFAALPDLMLTEVRRQLLAVLENSEAAVEFPHLSQTDRQNILEILRETKPALFEIKNESN